MSRDFSQKCMDQSLVFSRLISFKGSESGRSFAARIGASDTMLINWKRGAMMNDATIQKAAERLGTTYLYLRCGMGPRKAEEALPFWQKLADQVWAEDLGATP